MKAQKFSIGFKSGLLPGQGSDEIPKFDFKSVIWSEKNCFNYKRDFLINEIITDFVLWQGAESS